MTHATATVERPRVDPRIRARRIAVRRHEGRQRLRRVMALGVVLGGLAAVAGAAFSPLLDVDRIRVDGAARSGSDAVLAAAGLRTGVAMVAVDGDGAAARVEELPWVAEVEVARAWPGMVVVQVTERTAAAAVADGEGTWLLIDADGRALERVTGEAPTLPVVDGLDPDAAPGELVTGADSALALVAVLPPSLRDRVTGVATDADAIELEVVLANGERALAELGPPTQLEAKLVSLATILEQVDPAGLTRIDLRVPDVSVLTRR